ncbi:MAG: Mov34/MPN/PAD-1 family protein [Candidatus Helarchaeota archaeon]
MGEEKKEEGKDQKEKMQHKPPSDFKEQGIVKVSLDAYKTIILHASRFANSKLPIDTWKEIMGFLIGKIEGDDVIITKAIPMTHGSSVEVEFSDEHYIQSAQINSWAAERDLFMVGWYHSHPGLGLFLSSTDIKNQLAYQGPNPKAIALVYDHTLLDPPNHHGFLIFKLDSPDMGVMSDFHEVPFEIEDMGVKDFTTTLVEMIEKQSARQPLIAEYGEDTSLMKGVEGGSDSATSMVSTTPLGEVKITVPPLNFDLVTEGMVNTFKAMIQEVLPAMFTSFSDQTQAIAGAFQDLANRQVKAMNEFTELISLGIGEVREKIMSKIEESHEGTTNIMATNFQHLTETVEKSSDDVSDIEDRIIDDIVKTREELGEKFGVFKAEFTDDFGKEFDNIKSELSDVEKEIVDKLRLSQDAAQEELVKIIEMKINDAIKNLNINVTKRFNDLEEKLNK